MAKGKNKVPKTVAGVKVPKPLRRSKSLKALFGSPLGREILADALIAAAGAAAAALVKHRPSAGQVARAGGAVAEAGVDAAAGTRDLVQTAAGAVAEVVADAAKTVLPSSLTGEDRRDERRQDRSSDFGHIADRESGRGKKAKHRDKAAKH